jgi:methylmalonyl-CoA/ethylmalonyl-CoA epimerase
MTMAPNVPLISGLGPVAQLGYVVTDLAAAFDLWVDMFGAGPFFLFENVEFPGWSYRGVETPTPLNIAAGQLGSLVIELILPRGEGPSAYRDSFAKGTGGLHHYGVLVDDPDAAARHFAPAAPVTTACTGAGTRFAYFDARPQLGVMVEIIEHGPDVRELFGMIADAAKGWDGTDRLRPLAL